MGGYLLGITSVNFASLIRNMQALPRRTVRVKVMCYFLFKVTFKWQDSAEGTYVHYMLLKAHVRWITVAI